MRIANWMKAPVHTVKPLDGIGHAREIMERYRINQLPVVVDGRLVGIVTDRDLRDAFPSVFQRRRRFREAAVPLEQLTVEDVMTANVRSLGPRDLLVDAARLMRRERIGAVPVVDGPRRLVGILTRSDLLDALAELLESGATLSQADQIGASLRPSA